MNEVITKKLVVDNRIAENRLDTIKEFTNVINKDKPIIVTFSDNSIELFDYMEINMFDIRFVRWLNKRNEYVDLEDYVINIIQA